MSEQRAKRGGRRERLAQRAAKPAVDPCPPGQIGGAYKPLTGAECERIYSTALDLLAKLGMGEVPPRLHDDLVKAGAEDNGAGRLLFPPQLVEQAIDQA
ncbi:MAG: trimethylamine methyltransferase, partial [Leisingera sp.]